MSDTQSNDRTTPPSGSAESSLPPAPDTSSFYTILEVDEDASKGTIKNAFRQQLQRHHPDKSDRDDAGEIVKALKTAREHLLDDEYRAVYDATDHGEFVSTFLDGSAWPGAGEKQTTIDAFLSQQRTAETRVNPDEVREAAERKRAAQKPGADRTEHEQSRWNDFDWFDGPPEEVDVDESDRSWLIPVPDRVRYANPDADLDSAQKTVGGFARKTEAVKEAARKAGERASAGGQGIDIPSELRGNEDFLELTADEEYGGIEGSADSGPSIDRSTSYSGVTTSDQTETEPNDEATAGIQGAQPRSPAHTSNGAQAGTGSIFDHLNSTPALTAICGGGWLVALVLTLIGSGDWVIITTLAVVAGPVYVLYDQ